MTDLRREHELLLCVARKSLDESLADRLRLILEQKIDWTYLIQTASDHRLLPLLYIHLKDYGADLVPSAQLQQLQSEYLSNSQGNLYLLRELLGVLELLNRSDIRALAFKGPVLGSLLYGGIALRQTGDIDIMISKQDFSRATELLQSAGYRMDPPLTAAQQASLLRAHCEMQYHHSDGFSVVDLHWRLTPKTFSPFIEPEKIFARSQKISVAGHSIETFANEDLFLYLCVHAAKHYWSRLEWLTSICELVRLGSIDWNVISDEAKASRSENMLYLAFLLMQDLFSVSLPPELADLPVGRDHLRSCARKIQARIFAETPRPPTQGEIFRFNLQFMDRRRDAVASLLRSVLVPTISDWEAVKLPDALYPLYYVLRPLRLLRKRTAFE
jgi:hypothetical protein